MKYVLLLPLIFLSGCISVLDIFSTPTQVVGGGLIMNLQADPQTVFSSGRVRLNIDLDNENPRRITGVVFDIFDPGLLTISASQPLVQSCRALVDVMLPDEFKTFACVLEAPSSSKLVSDRAKTTVHARAEYTTDLPTVQLVEMMTEDEYLRRLETGQLVTKPKSYSYKDKNVELLVEFSEQLPIIVRTQKEYFVHFTVKNVGNGFIRKLSHGDFTVSKVEQQSPQIADCTNSGILDQTWSIEPVGDTFPRITCRLSMPGGVNVVENYGLLVNLVYDYEVREKVDVEIAR